MLRHLPQPFDTAVLVLRIPREAHLESPPIMPKMRLMGIGWPLSGGALVASLKSPKSFVISSMCAGESSLRLEPRLLRIFCQKELASINCTLPLRGAGLRLETIQM